jgi:hypothetical protein
VADAFLGAQLLADALAEGLAGNGGALDIALSGYQEAFRYKTLPMFDFTIKAANLKDFSSALPLYARIAQSREETTRFMARACRKHSLQGGL